MERPLPLAMEDDVHLTFQALLPPVDSTEGFRLQDFAQPTFQPDFAFGLTLPLGNHCIWMVTALEL